MGNTFGFSVFVLLLDLQEQSAPFPQLSAAFRAVADSGAKSGGREAPRLAVNAPEFHVHEPNGPIASRGFRYAFNQEREARKISQADAAKVLGVTQPKVSALRRYKLEGFSVERLMNLLTALDQDVEIVIRRKPRSRKAGRISVVAAECCKTPGLAADEAEG